MCCNRMAGIRLAVSLNGNGLSLLLQYDQRWDYGDYGNSSVAVSGCGPACLSMVITSLTGDDTITPYVVAQYASEQGTMFPALGLPGHL